MQRSLRTESVSWFRESYHLPIDNHAAFENGALISAPGLNIDGEGLEQAFEIREGVVIPPL